MRDEVDIQKELVTILDYYKYRLTTGGCTLSEMNSLGRMLAQNMDIEGTVEEFSKFYGVSEANVRNVINRYMVQKPKRRVFYKFHQFNKIVPSKWLNSK